MSKGRYSLQGRRCTMYGSRSTGFAGEDLLLRLLRPLASTIELVEGYMLCPYCVHVGDTPEGAEYSTVTVHVFWKVFVDGKVG